MVNNQTDTEQSDDTTALVRSLQREAERKIQELHTHGELKEKEIRNAAAETLKKYEEDIKSRSDNKVKGMLEKLRHRHELDKKKLIMGIIESCIDDSIRNTITAIHTESPQIYHEYLKERIDSISGITVSNSCTILFRKEDDTIIQSLLSCRASLNKETAAITLEHDTETTYGGIRVVDNQAGICYDGTLDRAVFRKREEIRTALHKVITDFISVQMEKDT